MQIDAHQHFWQISRGDYDWMTDEVSAIRHDILPKDARPLLAKHKIDGTVLVQAAATVAETEFMLSLADANTFIKAVVGWIDLDDPAAPNVMDHLMKWAAFKGVRPMLQDIDNTEWIMRPTVLKNLSALSARGLRLDGLILPRHLDVFFEVVDRYPDLSVVIDHCAKPVIADGADAGDAWRKGMSRLASYPHVFCKLSGLVNEAGPRWTTQNLQAIVDHILAEFGASRVMWGSDWPVLNLVADYDQWRAASIKMLEPLSPQEKRDIFGGTATRFYGLDMG